VDTDTDQAIVYSLRAMHPQVALYSFIFAHISPKNAQPIGKISCVDRDKVWKELCKEIRTFLIQ